MITYPLRHRLGRVTAALAAVTIAAVTLTGCGGSEAKPAKRTPNVTAAPTTTLAPDTPAAPSIATATVSSVGVFASPSDAAPAAVLENPWLVNNQPSAAVPQVFFVTATRPGWVQVQLPSRPNGSLGWVHAEEVRIEPARYRIEVSLGEHTLRLFDGDQEVLSDNVAIGAAATPTPEGRFYIRVLMKAPNPNSGYGPYAFGLSAHSEVLEEFNGGDAEIGIHGNNDTSALGRSVSHGCIRMANDKLLQVVARVPLGTPVDIRA